MLMHLQHRRNKFEIRNHGPDKQLYFKWKNGSLFWCLGPYKHWKIDCGIKVFYGLAEVRLIFFFLLDLTLVDCILHVLQLHLQLCQISCLNPKCYWLQLCKAESESSLFLYFPTQCSPESVHKDVGCMWK